MLLDTAKERMRERKRKNAPCDVHVTRQLLYVLFV